MDYNIDNYTDKELYKLLDLEGDVKYSNNEIVEATNNKLNTFEKEDTDLKKFFVEIGNKLLNDNYESGDQNTLLIDVEQDKVEDTNVLSIKRGELNPTFKNTIKRTINIDSKYRKNSFPVKNSDIRYSDVMTMNTSIYSTTDFTCNLTDKLTNVISIQLYSYCIPYSWYNINKHNNTFKINGEVVTIEPGNYTNIELVEEISNNDVFTENGGSIEYNVKTSKVAIDISGIGELVFYTNEESFIESRSNYNLGWTLGYRNSIYGTEHGSLSDGSYRYVADSIVDISGPKYIVLILDEYSSNVDNVGMVSIETGENKLSVPNYFSNDLDFSSRQEEFREIPYYGIAQTVNNVKTRGITQAQQTTINEIIKSRNETTNNKLVIPRDNNTLAVIPLVKNVNFGDHIDIFGGIKDIKRSYFGPLTIDKLGIKLMDDNGFTLDLNGLDWSVSLVTEHLYKYS